MAYARDKLYKGYLRRNMPTIVSKVKVREILPHLPCLTDHDRETVEAKRETYGNYDGMMLLLDCLKRRENWPEEFISALEACEHPTIAAEIRAEYESLKGASSESADSNPSSPATTAVRAQVHPAPSASHPPMPENGENSQAAVSTPAEASTPPEPAAQPSPPLQVPVQPQPPQIPAAQVPEDIPPSEPTVEPPKAAQIEVAPPPSTPPPSPATPHTQASAPPAPHRDINFHQEPEENSESDVQAISADDGVIPDQVSVEKEEVSIDDVELPEASDPVELSEIDTPACSDLLQTTTTTEAMPPRSPSPTENDSDVADGAPVTMLTPERRPVQDTTPPAAALEPEDTSKPSTTQAVESSPQREITANLSPPLATAEEVNDPLLDDVSECLSKPGELISVQPQNHDDTPTICVPSSPYSGDSGRLQMSADAPETVILNPTLACSAAMSAIVNSEVPCVENGFANSHNEPEENQYDSPSQSLEMQEVLESIGQICEEPSILNLAGQNSPTPAQIVNGEAAKEIKPAPLATAEPTDSVSDVKTPSSEDYNPPSEPAPADISTEPKMVQDSGKKPSRMLHVNTKYIVAAGVGACALLMAWKFKN
ncbi:mitochondrial antiviral-signaling protein isoform X1 [Cheilinus undulatus]|uniref:mitochondrial antiviral-signaling protein isoform X1 n=1 Tax=Cheilinus undulatus TaxID=241271 RepID=UPI001BD5DC25|nr:mitochondrial antiviral-signaling protein isoform X1 [Cheilinus undulatus]XP_041669478.1 mitochondrial antiviral-signaling protein isoform X1 [Cheilinus undulatus]